MGTIVGHGMLHCLAFQLGKELIEWPSGLCWHQTEASCCFFWLSSLSCFRYQPTKAMCLLSCKACSWVSIVFCSQRPMLVSDITCYSMLHCLLHCMHNFAAHCMATRLVLIPDRGKLLLFLAIVIVLHQVQQLASCQAA